MLISSVHIHSSLWKISHVLFSHYWHFCLFLFFFYLREARFLPFWLHQSCEALCTLCFCRKVGTWSQRVPGYLLNYPHVSRGSFTRFLHDARPCRHAQISIVRWSQLLPFAITIFLYKPVNYFFRLIWFLFRLIFPSTKKLPNNYAHSLRHDFKPRPLSIKQLSHLKSLTLSEWG